MIMKQEALDTLKRIQELHPEITTDIWDYNGTNEAVEQMSPEGRAQWEELWDAMMLKSLQSLLFHLTDGKEGERPRL